MQGKMGMKGGVHGMFDEHTLYLTVLSVSSHSPFFNLD